MRHTGCAGPNGIISDIMEEIVTECRKTQFLVQRDFLISWQYANEKFGKLSGTWNIIMLDVPLKAGR